MGKLFNNNIYIALLFIIIFWIIALINSLIIIIINIPINNENDSKKYTKTVMIIKIIQLPAYLIIFIVGLICILTIFTLPITFLLILFHCLSISLTGIIGILSVIKLQKLKTITLSEMIVFGLLQFIFCIDVFISIILFTKAKKIYF